MKTEEQKFLKLMEHLRLSMVIFEKPLFIHKFAKKRGAIKCYSIGKYGEICFNFNKNGKFVGLTGDSIDSFQGPKK